MRKNPYIISTFILSILLIISLFFYHDATKRPPTVFGGFSNRAKPPSNVNVAMGIDHKNNYQFQFRGTEFDRGSYTESAENTYILKPKKGVNGILIVTNKDSYLYYPKLSKKVIVVKKVSDIPVTIDYYHQQK